MSENKKIDTLRLLITTRCNLDCSYCCNKKEKFSSKFQHKELSQIDFSRYQSVCLTGGEPFLERELLWNLIENVIPQDKNIYIYSNGLLIQAEDVKKIKSQENIKCVNIGIHDGKNVEEILGKNLHPSGGLPRGGVRFSWNSSVYEKYLKKPWFSSFLPCIEETKKLWEMDDCERENEDWVVLKPELKGRRVERLAK